MQGNYFDSSKLDIPASIWIGVTGHRTLEDEGAIRQGIRTLLARLELDILESNPTIPWTFVVVSPLAEGADRIVAEEVLQYRGHNSLAPMLQSVLPFREEEYIQDFKTKSSIDQFRNLLAKSNSIRHLPLTSSREDAYLAVGQYVVDCCDVLIAVWDGKKANGRGGTEEILKYARRRKRWIFWINSENGMVNDISDNDREKFRIALTKSIESLSKYNSEKLNPNELEASIKTRYKRIAKKADLAGLQATALQPHLCSLIPEFAKSALLARKYKNKYIRSGVAISILSAAAVATVTIQLLFFNEFHSLLYLEAMMMLVITALLIGSELFEWRRKWVDYRLIAELLRASIYYLVLIKDYKYELVKMKSSGELWGNKPILNSSFLIQDWRNWAYSWILLTRKDIHLVSSVESLKDFLLNSWIRDQISYYENNSKYYRSRYILLERAGIFLFLLTLAVAVLYIHHADGNFSDLSYHYAAAIILPALGSCLSSIKIYREYLLNAERYERIRDHLKEIDEQIQTAQDQESLISLAIFAEKMMLSEHLDWCEIMEKRVPNV